MLPPSASEKKIEMLNLPSVSDLIDFQNKKIIDTNYDFENELITFNSGAPQLTQFQNRLVSEIPSKHLLITRVSVPPQYAYSILDQLIDLQESPKYSFIKDKIYSAFLLPNDQSSLFFEGPTIDEIIQLFSIFKNIFSITENDIIQFTDVSDIIHEVCNPLRTISFQIGNLIRISTPSFQDQVVQIIDFYPKKLQILIKFCPRIDYDLLIEKGVNSQVKLNNMMPQDYIAPLKVFEPEKLKSSIPSIDIRKKEMKLTWSDDPVIFDFWDDSLFLSPFQYKKMDISHLNISPLNLESQEIELFKKGLTELEKGNETFIRNFQMSYDPSYETIENDFKLIDPSENEFLNKFEWNQNSEDIQKSLNISTETNQNFEPRKNKEDTNFSAPSSSIEDKEKTHKVHIEKISASNSNTNIESKDRIKSQGKRPHPSSDKKTPEILKAGDVILSRTPLENIRLKVREVDNQRIIKADFLNIPIIGRMNQFSKAPPYSSYKSEKSVYEVNKPISPQSSSASMKDIKNQIIPPPNQLTIKSGSMNPSVDTQCDFVNSSMFRIGDIVSTKSGKKCIILRCDESDINSFDLMDFNNNEITVDCSEISHILSNDPVSTDHDGNTLFLFNSVNTDDGETGEIYAMHEGNVFVRVSDGSNLFYNQNRLRLDTSCIFTSNNQMNNNYNNNYKNTNNYGNGYNNSNNYDSSYSNSNYDNGYSNSRSSNNNNNFNYPYNDSGNNRMGRNSPESSRYAKRNINDDRQGYDNYNSSNRSSYNDNGSRMMASSTQSKHTPPPPQSKSSTEKEKLPVWVSQNAIVTVSGKKEDAIINSIQNNEITVQFLDPHTQRVNYGSFKYQLKDLKPKPFDIGDNVTIVYRNDKFVGKVIKLTAHHVLIDIRKKKKDKPDIIEGLIKNAFRCYDWESLDDI